LTQHAGAIHNLLFRLDEWMEEIGRWERKSCSFLVLQRLKSPLIERSPLTRAIASQEIQPAKAGFVSLAVTLVAARSTSEGLRKLHFIERRRALNPFQAQGGQPFPFARDRLALPISSKRPTDSSSRLSKGFSTASAPLPTFDADRGIATETIWNRTTD